jgi:hypothetical protein
MKLQRDQVSKRSTIVESGMIQRCWRFFEKRLIYMNIVSFVFLSVLLHVNSIYCNVQHIDSTNMTEITSKIAADYFEKIVGFVIHVGDRQTYCNKYNHSPHLKCDTLNIYLNPTSQFVNWTAESLSEKISDYNEICISTNNTKMRNTP